MLTKSQAIILDEFHHGECQRHVGPRGGVSYKIETWRRNGKTLLWKRSPERFTVPIKFGMYRCSRITESDAANFHSPTDCPAKKL